MRKILFLALLSLFAYSVNAQFKVVAEGPVFKEPEDGQAKLVQLKNGGTVFIDFFVKKGLNLRMYDAAHHEIAETSYKTKEMALDDGRFTTLTGLFEINGDIVMFFTSLVSRVPTLTRYIIDAQTGKIKNQAKIGELDKVNMWQGYAVAFGDVPVPEFNVRKDANSDNYAVVMFNSFESERSKRIEIIAFGSDNQEVSRAYYASPQEKFKYMKMVDMVVLGADKVCVLAYAYNTGHSGGKESEMIMANLDKGQTAVSYTELGFTKDVVISTAITTYNPVSQNIILIALTKERKGSNAYIPIMAFIDPYQKKILRANTISPTKRIDAFSKGGFTGLPEDVFLNDDGSFTVISEEMTIYTSNYSVYTTLGDMAIVNYSKTGDFLDDHIIRKSQQLNNEYLYPLYHAERLRVAQFLKDGNQYKSFSYLNGKTKSFVLLNDTKRNSDNQQEGKLVTVIGVSGCDAFYYPIKGEQIVPNRDYVFGEPDKSRDHNLAIFTLSDYDRQNNLYTTLKLENEGGKKGVKVVWMQPQ